MTEPWDQPKHHKVSPLNYRPEIQQQYAWPKPLRIYDATIKRIGATPGMREFTTADKVRIAKLLDAIGIAEIGVNPGWFTDSVTGDVDIEAASALCRAGLRMKVSGAMEDRRWVNGDYSYLDKAISTGVFALELGLSWRMYRTSGNAGAPPLPEWAEKTNDQIDLAVGRAVEHIRSRGIEAGVLFAPPMRDEADLDRLLQQMNRYIDHGAQRFRMGDTLGTLNPEATRFVIRYILKGLKQEVPLTYVVHDPFGTGTAVAIAATAAGAQPETHVNGIAHKGGTSLEELVMALEIWYGVDTGIKLSGLADLCAAVEEITGIPNHPYKPIVGPAMWAPSWGWQLKELLAGNDGLGTFMAPFNPEVAGARVNLAWSSICTDPGVVEAKLKHLGLAYTAPDVSAIFATLEARLKAMTGYPAWIPDAEVERICRERLT